MTFDPAADETAFFQRSDELATQFETWVRASRIGVDPPAASGDASMLFNWKFSYADGDLSRWNTADLQEFLIEWCPRKVSGPADLMATIPENVGLVMEFLGTTGLLSRDSPPPRVLSQYAAGLQDEFQTQMASPANFGMAKSIFASLGVDDPTSLGPDQLEKLIAEFNDLPQNLRRSITDPAVQAMAEPQQLGTIQLPEPGQLLASVLAAPMTVAFERLAEYFATGRTLTKGGAITVADARVLAELLETGEEPVADDGHQSFRRRTAQNYPAVMLWVEWATWAGVLRRHRGKLVVVAKWVRSCRGDAIGTIVAAAADLVMTGPLALTTSFYLRNDELVDDHAFAILLEADRSGPQQFADVLEVISDATAAEDDDQYPGIVRSALDRLLARLTQAGVVTQTGVEAEPGEYGFLQRRASGTLTITALGTAVIGQLAKVTGANVILIPAPSQITVDELSTLARVVDSPEVWWRSVGGFLDALPSADHVEASIVELVTRLAASSHLMMGTVLARIPEGERDRWEPGLRRVASGPAPALTVGRDETVQLLVLHSLDQNGLVNNRDSPDELLRAGLTAAGVFCAEDAATFATDLSANDGGAETAVDLIADVARLLPPHASDLLDAIGRHYPDKRIAKLARKELFRVRSKLAAAHQLP